MCHGPVVGAVVLALVAGVGTAEVPAGLTTNPPKCLPPAGVYLMGYTLGALTVEALSAIAGPQGAMAVVTLLGRGQTFPQAFKSVYGISWAEAAPILAKVVAAEYAATP